MVTKLLFLTLLISVVSCGPKKEASVPVKLKVFRSNIATSASMSGGVVIVGRSEDNLDSFRLALADANQDITLDLKKGKWEFAAVAWSGGTGGLLTGVNRCSGTSMIDLKDAEATVNFNLTQARCLTPYSSKSLAFTESSFQNSSGAFFSIKPILCLSSVLTPANCPVGSNATIFKSYKVLIPMERKGAVVGNLSELMTNCQTIAAGSSMTLPLGNMTDSSPFGMKVNVYPNTTCSGTPNVMDFSSGIIHSVAKDNSKALIPDTANQWALLIVNPGAQAASNSVMVAGGMTHTNSLNPSVVFEPLAADITEVCFTTTNSSASCSGPDWRTILTSPQTLLLSAPDGLKTVYMFTKTASGLISLIGSDSIILDTAPPEFAGTGTYASAYNTSPVTLSWTAFNDMSAVVGYNIKSCSAVDCLTSCSVVATGATSTIYNWADTNEGINFICVAATDAVGNISSYSSVGSYEFDSTSPTVASLILSSGVSYTSTLSLSYNFSSSGGATQQCFSESLVGTSCSPWVAFSLTGTHTIAPGDGLRTIYVHVKDDAGNIASTSDQINVDTTAPTNPGFATLPTFLNDGDFPYNVTWGQSIDVNMDAYHTKVCQTIDCVTTCGGSVSGPGSIASATLDISAQSIIEGTNYICVRADDIAFNQSAYTNVATFIKDSIAPTVAGVALSLDSGKAYTNLSNVPWSITGSPVGANEMCITSSASSSSCAGLWTGISSSGTFTLAFLNAGNTVYVFYKDAAGNISTSISDFIEHDNISPSPLTLNAPTLASEVEGFRVYFDFSGGADTNPYTFHVKICDNPSCSGIVYGSRSISTIGPDKVDADPVMGWALNTDAYLMIKAEDLAGNFSASIVSASIKRVNYLRAQEVAVGGQHTCALLSDGRVKCYGLNTSGQLGIGSTTSKFGSSLAEMGDNLMAVTLPGNYAKQVATGSSSSCALLMDGSVKCWGNNLYGTLGQGNTTQYTSPVSVDIGTKKAIQIAMHGSHVCILDEVGDIKCWGKNSNGQLGIGGNVNIGISGGQMGASLAAVNLGIYKKAIKVVVGEGFTCALMSDRKVKCWGDNTYGQLGQGDMVGVGVNPGEVATLSAIDLNLEVRDIVAGNSHACALLVNGEMKCWGNNSYGALGNGSTIPVGDQPSEMGLNLPAINIVSGKKVIQIAAGNETTCALLEDGVAKCWGRGDQGLVGQNNTLLSHLFPSSMSPIDLGTGKKIRSIAIGNQNACAIMDSGEMQCWGMNGHGEGHSTTIGTGVAGGEMGNIIISKFVRLGYSTKQDVMKIATGNSHNCALFYNGKIKCWGNNNFGQIGNWELPGGVGTLPSQMGDNLSYVDFGEIHFKDVVSGGIGSDSTCALSTSGDVRCWGANDRQQLGVSNSGSGDIIGDNNGEVGISMPPLSFGPKKIRSVEMGSRSTCVLTAGGEVYCFGDNMYGQLGIDSNSSLDLISTAVSSLTAIQLSMGESHTCALFGEGQLKCWGLNSSGQLGQGNMTNIGTASDAVNSVLGIDVKTNAKVIKVDAGKNSTCALLDDHSVKCWGYNGLGILGMDIDDNVSDDSSPTIVGSSPVSFESGNSYALDIQVGGESACVLKANGNVRCWGDNSYGQLGINSNSPNHIGSSISLINSAIDAALGASAPVRSLYMGMSGCVISGMGGAVCWGTNMSGQAGQGSNAPEFGTATQSVPSVPINL